MGARWQSPACVRKNAVYKVFSPSKRSVRRMYNDVRTHSSSRGSHGVVSLRQNHILPPFRPFCHVPMPMAIAPSLSRTTCLLFSAHCSKRCPATMCTRIAKNAKGTSRPSSTPPLPPSSSSSPTPSLMGNLRDGKNSEHTPVYVYWLLLFDVIALVG